MLNQNIQYDICIIGAGAGGLSVASGAAQLGLKVALIEGNNMGGDCLNYGCVPSKSLLSSAKHYYMAKHSQQFGFAITPPQVEIKNVMQKVHEVMAKIAPHDSVERFEGLGVKVYRGYGSFIDENTVSVNKQLFKAKYFVIATGSSPVIPPITGLNTVAYLTNETIFDLQETPEHLIVIGGGPIGCELAEAFAMFGIKTSILSLSKILPKDEPDMVEVLRGEILKTGIDLYEDISITEISKNNKEINVIIKNGNSESTISGSHILIATGRKPNLEKLNLAVANIKYNKKGVEVDTRLRTSNKQVFAIGDASIGYQFTHIASYHAGIVIRNIIFRQRAEVNYKAMPWVTYTYPELAHCGLSEDEARKTIGNIKVTEFEYQENDRAQAERASIGKIKLITTTKGIVLGVSILGLNAGELLAPWIDLINRGEVVKALTKNIIPYPTLSEINKQVIGEYYKPILFSNKVKFLVKFLKIFW